MVFHEESSKSSSCHPSVLPRSVEASLGGSQSGAVGCRLSRGERRELHQPLLAYPAFYSRASEAGYEHALRHSGLFVGEHRIPVGECLPVQHVGRHGGMPALSGRDVLLELSRAVLGGHLVHAYHVVVGEVDLRIPVQQPLDRGLLVGLSGKQPYVAHEHVANGDFVHFKQIRASGLVGRHRHGPVSLGGRLGKVVLPVEAYGHFLAGIRPAPDHEFAVSLQYHAVGDHFRKPDSGHSGPGAAA